MKEIIQLGVEAAERTLPWIEKAIERLDSPSPEAVPAPNTEDASVH